MLVDDEPLALVHLRRQLTAVGGADIVAACTNVHEALSTAAALKPDAVFIDIMMPEINGLEAAERLLDLLPNVQVVFVTAHDDFAVQAFELNAIDYVLKPAEAGRLRKTLERIARRLPAPSVPPAASTPPMIRCFQRLQVGDVSPTWRTAKARELFAFFVHRRNQIVRKDYLVEALWPGYEFKKGYTMLYTTIYHVRKTMSAISAEIALDSTDSGYTLDLKGAPLDVELWERALEQAPPMSHESLGEHMELSRLYRGDYLAEYDFLWAEAERERLRILWYQHALKLSAFLGTTDRYEQAVDVNSRILAWFPYSEEAYWQLMKLYDALGDRSAVKRYYEQLSEMLQSEFGTPPSGEIRTWFEQSEND